MRLIRGRYVDAGTEALDPWSRPPPGNGTDRLDGGPADPHPTSPPRGAQPTGPRRRRSVRLAAVAALAVVTALVAASVTAWATRPASTDPRAAAAAAIVTSFYDALSRGDSVAAGRLVSSEARHEGNGTMGGDTSPIAGTALLEYLADLLATRDLTAELTGPPEVRFDGADAIVTVPNRLGYRSTGAEPFAVEGTTVVVLHDYDGTWRIDQHAWVGDGYLGASGRRFADLGTPRICPSGSRPDVARAAGATGAAGSARPGWITGMAVDPAAGMLVATAGDQTWRFDLCSNTWSRSRSSVVPDPDVGPLAYDVRTGRFVAFSANGTVAWTYAVATDTWTRLPASTSLLPPIANHKAAYDARSGVLLAVGLTAIEGYGRVWAFDPVADRWDAVLTRGTDLPSFDDASPLVFDPGADLLVLLGREGVAPNTGPTTWRFDPRDRTWNEGTAGPLSSTAWGWGLLPTSAVYDPTSELVVTSDGSNLAAYDAGTDRWIILPRRPGPAAATIVGLAADPVNGRVVVAAVRTDQIGREPVPQLWGLDLRSGAWMPLTR